MIGRDVMNELISPLHTSHQEEVGHDDERDREPFGEIIQDLIGARFQGGRLFDSVHSGTPWVTGRCPLNLTCVIRSEERRE